MFQRRLALCLVAMTVIGMVGADTSAQPPGEQLIDKVMRAYQQTDHYDATLTMTLKTTLGRWTNTQSAEIYVALDRPGNRLMIDLPDQMLVVDGKTLFYRADQFPGKHLEIDAVTPLTGEWVMEQAPGLIYPAVPTDIAFLLSVDPLLLVSQGAAGAPATVPADPDDPSKRPRIETALQAGRLALTVDPATFLIDRAVVDVDRVQMNLPRGSTMSYTFEIDVHDAVTPVADGRFVFDTTNSKPSKSLQQMMASGSNRPHPLVDQAAPGLKLPTIDGLDHDIAVDDQDAKVIVLDFWATWCGPCVRALPGLQEVYDWAQEEGKPVAIYAVNQGETAEVVKQFWEDHGLTIPVLMDEEFAAAGAYQVSGIPQTVIIADGVVRYVHVGYGKGMEEQIKAEIEGLLAE